MFGCRSTSVSYKVIPLLMVDVARHAQSAHNNNFAIFLHEDEHESFLQADNSIAGHHIQACPKYPK